jgi:hypothetical protein
MKIYLGFGPARHDPLNSDRVVPRLHLRPSGSARHDPFLFRVVSGLISKGTSPTGLKPGRPGTTRWSDIVVSLSLTVPQAFL